MNVLQTIASPAAVRSTRMERAEGTARVTVKAPSRLDVLYQSGAAKVRLPRTEGGPLEAVFLNTAGGITGGDRLSFTMEVGAGAKAVATTQAAERIYRRLSGVAEVDNRLVVGEGGRLDWIPQETILFDRSALSRRLEADVAADGTLLGIESIVLGRAAMGESIRTVFARDAWRVRRAGRLVFADTTRLDGDTTVLMAGGATGKGAIAFATLLLVSPEAEAALPKARAAIAETSGEAGCSAWNGMLVARFIAAGGKALRADLVRLVEALRGRPMPRVWNC